MSSIQYVGEVLSAFADAFQPLEDSLAAGQSLSALLADFGWRLDPSSDVNAIQAAFGSLPSLLTTFRNAVTALQSSGSSGKTSQIADAVTELTIAIGKLITSIQALSGTTPNSAWPAPLSSNLFWETFPLEVLDYLLCRYLESHAPKIFTALRLIGVLNEDYSVPLIAGRVPFVRRGVRWDRLSAAVTDPQDVLKDVYGWGGAFAAHRLIDNLRGITIAFGRPALVHEPSHDLLDAYYDQGAASRKEACELSIPLYWGISELGSALALVMVELAVLPIPPADQKGGAAVGLALYPRVTGDAAESVQLTQSVSLQIKGGFISEAAIRAEIRPDSVNIFVDPILSAGIDAAVTINAKPAAPWIPIGHKSSSRLELRHVHGALRAAGTVPDIEFIIQLATDDAALIIQFDEGDGFLRQILGDSPKTLGLPLTLSWSNKRGLRFGGQEKLEATVPIHQSILGVISFDSITIGLGASTEPPGVALTVSVTGGLNLGPIAAVVERVGVQAKLTFVPLGQSPGNLGSVDLTWAFLPPKGVGLSIDAGAVVGGGYLFFDSDKEQYAGVLQLELVRTIAIKAIGLLTTRMPDGSKGFSLLVIITAEGFGPIQLGFGFTLTGIGGLLGVNRTAAVDALRSGLRTGAIGSILFPIDPVRNAQRIVSDVGTVFPPAVNRYVFGPMAMINWGTPAILTLEIGLVLEVPDPIRLLILGRLQALLPDEKNALVQIRMDSLGVIDFGTGEVSLDATLYDSRLLTFVLTGDMAMRANFGQNPGFLLAVGGWNPRFPSPAGFPSLSRTAITLSSSDNARLRLESYLAVTSNTLQFGARADFYFAEGPFSVEGYLGFDALFHFAPFSFLADLGASVALRSGGTVLMSVDLVMTLSGPSPWHVWGQAKFIVLGFKQSVSFDAKYGPDPVPELPDSVDVKALLVTALNDARNWSGELPAGERPLVVFRSSTITDVLRVHPLAQLAVRERVVPLDMSIDRFGNAPVSGDKQFSLKAVRSDNAFDIPSENISDSFALAQFLEMSDDQRLSSPAFTQEHAGIRFTTGDFAYGYEPALDTAITYETLMILDGQPTAQQLKPYTVTAVALDGIASLGAAAQAAKQSAVGRPAIRRT